MRRTGGLVTPEERLREAFTAEAVYRDVYQGHDALVIDRPSTINFDALLAAADVLDCEPQELRTSLEECCDMSMYGGMEYDGCSTTLDVDFLVWVEM